MTGGGTAGHIHPALTIARALQSADPKTEILFVGAKGRMETRLVPQAGFPMRTMSVSGFERSMTPKAVAHNIAACWHAVSGWVVSRRILRAFSPDVAVGTGGYVCGPVLGAAEKMGIPVVLHESNALPGVTVKMLCHFATVCLAEESARAHLPPETETVVTGNPIPPEMTVADRREARQKLKLDDRPLVLSFGGSLGARAINEAMAQVFALAGGEAQFVHGAGSAGYEEMRADLARRGIPDHGSGIWVREYIDDMADCLAAADLVVCRCGAMTLTELQACGKPSVLIPSPHVAENHQLYNAQALVERGAAVCLEEKDLTPETLWQTIRSLITSRERLSEMSERAREGAAPDALSRIVRVILSRARQPKE